MNLSKILWVSILILGLFNTGCKKEGGLEASKNTTDPNTLEVGTIVFDFEGETILTTEGDAVRQDDTQVAFQSIWVDVVDGDIITRQISMQIFGVNPLTEPNYELVWEDCTNNPNLLCGLFAYVRNDSIYSSQYDDTLLKINFQELGKETGENVIGTFEAKVFSVDIDNKWLDITNGAFNLEIR